MGSKVMVTRKWSEDDVLQVNIEVDNSYPDSLAEAKRVALDAFAEALAVTLASEVPKDETP